MQRPVEGDHQTQSVEWQHDAYKPASRTRQERKDEQEEHQEVLCVHDGEVAVVGVES